MKRWTEEGLGVALPDISELRTVPGTENTAAQRTAALRFTAELHALRGASC